MSRTHFLTSDAEKYGELLDKYLEGQHPGNIWFVGPGGTDSTANGRTPGAPFATLVYAISQAAASNGDVIYLLPGHTEQLDSAAEVNVNKAGLDIVGLGTGRARPTFSYGTDVAASFDINSANVLLENIVFDGTGIDAVSAMLNVKAANCRIRNCEFVLADSSNQATLGVLTTAAANRLLIEDCHFHGTADAGCTAAISLVGGSDIRIRNCDIIGDFSAGGIQQATTDAVNVLVDRCRIINLDASSTKAAVFTASTTGLISNCELGIGSGTAPLTCAGMYRLRNWYAAAVDTGGSAY